MSKEKLRVVGNYEYHSNDILGTGTWGTVYLARHAHCHSKQYAIKKMNKYKIEASQKSFLKYQSEVQALQKASVIHEVIKIIDFFKSQSNYYIVTEYFASSIDLYEYMMVHKNKFCEEEARVIWMDLLKAIGSLHEMGIYHRDLKLQNIVYVKDSKSAKVIDFGMATCFPNPEGIVGSPMFMSPQVLNNEKYTSKCDIWSLGIIFYCMIYRTSPYGENNTTKSILEVAKIIKEKGIDFPYDTYASKNCKQVILSCLRFEEEDRLEVDAIMHLPFFNKPVINQQVVLQYYEPCTSFKN